VDSKSRAFLASAVAALALVGAAHAQDPTIERSTCELLLAPGEQATIDVVVKVPGKPISPKADIYILADATGSMGPVLDSVKSNIASIAATLFSIPGADLRIGVGSYRDLVSATYAFDHELSLTTDQAQIIAAVSTFVAGSGGDPAEGAFFALQKLATDPAATYGWRPDTKRIVVWFGDAPSHDPICTQLTGLPSAITESSVIAALQASGTTVIGISTPTGLPAALNDDPLGNGTLNSQTYQAACGFLGGAPGQATRIAAATGGIHTAIASVNDITLAILQSILAELNEAKVELKALGGIVPLVTGISPPSVDIVLPLDPNQFVDVPFQVFVQAGACIENAVLEFDGTLQACINGQPTPAIKTVHIEQKACVALCVWGIGYQKTDIVISTGMPGPIDRQYIQPVWIYHVLQNQIPEIHIPNIPALIGAELYTQVLMFNPTEFPNDPIKVSNALMYKLGMGTAKFGTATGIQQYATVNPQLGGTVGMGFYFQ
jgi:hypothetical protein